MNRETLISMMNKFVEDVKAGNHQSEGWPSTCYGMSKLGLIAYTNVSSDAVGCSKEEYASLWRVSGRICTQDIVPSPHL